MNLSNIKKRVLFALWAIPAGWWFINSDLSIVPCSVFGQLENPEGVLFPGHVLALALAVLACYEYVRMLSIFYPRNGFWLVYLWLGFQATGYFLPRVALRGLLDTYILLIIVATEAIVWGRHTGRWRRASLLFSGTVFLSIALFSMFGFYATPFQTVFPARYLTPIFTQPGIVTVVAAIFLCDSSAYFVGSLWGRHRLSRISPKKTVEGAIGGLVMATVASTIGWHFFAEPRYPPLLGPAMGIVIGVFAQAGDLLVSLIKRYFRVKNASNMIPGHGGVLDRFDSVFFTVPMLNLFFVVVTKILG